MIRCYHCDTVIEIEGKVSRSETCPKCYSFLRCCLNCRFYSESAHNKCLEPAADWMSDKKAGNFCEYFEPGGAEDGDSGKEKDDARKKWDSLFKK